MADDITVKAIEALLAAVSGGFAVGIGAAWRYRVKIAKDAAARAALVDSVPALAANIATNRQVADNQFASLQAQLEAHGKEDRLGLESVKDMVRASTAELKDAITPISTSVTLIASCQASMQIRLDTLDKKIERVDQRYLDMANRVTDILGHVQLGQERHSERIAWVEAELGVHPRIKGAKGERSIDHDRASRTETEEAEEG